MLYWIFIGWWWEPIKWIIKLNLKLLYWIYIGWWVKLIANKTARKCCFIILGIIISTIFFISVLASFAFFIKKYWWIVIPLIFLIGILLSQILPFFKNLETTKTHNNLSTYITWDKIDSMNGHGFEYFCADLLRKSGFYDVFVTKGSGDKGIDIVAYQIGIKYVIQCKRYSSKIGNHAVQEVFSGKFLYNADMAVIITNNYFTAQAREDAARLGVFLWDRDVVNLMINSYLERLNNPRQVTNQKAESNCISGTSGSTINNDHDARNSKDAMNAVNDNLNQIKKLAEIINTTTDFVEFEYSLSEIKIKLKTLSEYEGLGIVYNSTSNKDLEKIIKNEELTRENFWERVANKKTKELRNNTITNEQAKGNTIKNQKQKNFSENTNDFTIIPSDLRNELDEYFEKAGEMIIEKNNASIPTLQRYFKIGFIRAEQIMNQLCEAGVVCKGEGTISYKILMTINDYREYLKERSVKKEDSI